MERLPVPKLAVKIVKVIYFFMKNVYDFYCLTYTDIMLLSTWLRPSPHFYCTNGQLGRENVIQSKYYQLNLLVSAIFIIELIQKINGKEVRRVMQQQNHLQSPANCTIRCKLQFQPSFYICLNADRKTLKIYCPFCSYHPFTPNCYYPYILTSDPKVLCQMLDVKTFILRTFLETLSSN